MKGRFRVIGAVAVCVLVLVAGFAALFGAGSTNQSGDDQRGADETANTESIPSSLAAVSEEEAIVIGMIADLTGPTAVAGTQYASGQREYVEAVNARGGVNGQEIVLLWQDYRYEVAAAERLYNQYVEQGAVAFMGWGTGDTEALRHRVAADKVPFMSASLAESLTDPADAPYNFVLGSTYSEQARVALEYIAAERSDATVAIFHSASPFGTSPLADAAEYIVQADLGIELNTIEMPTGVTDFGSQIDAADNPDYIIIQNVAQPAATLIRDLRSLETEAGLICLNWCGNETLIELAGADAEGVIAVQPFLGPASEVAGLDEIAEAAGGIENVSIAFIHGWTAMRTLVTAIERMGESGEEITGAAVARSLESTVVSTDGLSADIKFSSHSHAGMRGAPLQIVSDGVLVPYQDVIVPVDVVPLDS